MILQFIKLLLIFCQLLLFWKFVWYNDNEIARKGVIFTSEKDELTFDVEFMNCVVDKADNLVVMECDTHFSDFAGVHPSKISQGKLFLLDILMPQNREEIMRVLCKKNSPFVYLNFYIKNKDGEYVYVHCTGQNDKNSTLCRLTLADVSRSVEKSKALKAQAKQMNHLIDLVTGGVTLFKVDQDMHFEALYMNEACCNFFGTTKESYRQSTHRLDELIYPEDRSLVFQAIGNSMATQKPINIEVRVLTHKDTFVWCKMNSAIQRYDKDGCPIFHAIFTDITNVKQSEQRADKENEMMVKLFKNLPGAMFWTELGEPFKLRIVSSDFMKLIGYSRTELFEDFGGDLSKLMVESQINISSQSLKLQANEHKNLQVSYSLKTKRGEYIVVVDKRKVVEGDSGERSTIGMLSTLDSMKFGESFDI